MRPQTLLAAAALAALTAVAPALPAAASAHTSAPARTHAQAARTTRPIVIMNFGFSGGLTVHPGARVTVINRDAVQHTVTANGGAFRTRPIAPNGGRVVFTAPRRVGRYAFHCRFHPDMHGVLRVTR